MATTAKRTAEERIAEERERIRRSKEAIKRIRQEETERLKREARERWEAGGRTIEDVSGFELDRGMAELLGQLMWEVLEGGEEGQVLRAEAERVARERAQVSPSTDAATQDGQNEENLEAMHGWEG